MRKENGANKIYPMNYKDVISGRKSNKIFI